MRVFQQITGLYLMNKEVGEMDPRSALKCRSSPRSSQWSKYIMSTPVAMSGDPQLKPLLSSRQLISFDLKPLEKRRFLYVLTSTGFVAKALLRNSFHLSLNSHSSTS